MQQLCGSRFAQQDMSHFGCSHKYGCVLGLTMEANVYADVHTCQLPLGLHLQRLLLHVARLIALPCT